MGIRALCLGGLTWDELVTVPRMPERGGHVLASSRAGAAGGVCRSALALAMLGADVTVRSKIGAGEHSYRAQRELQDAGVTCELFPAPWDAVSTIILDGDERTIIGYPAREDLGSLCGDASEFSLILCATSDTQAFGHALSTAPGAFSSYDAGGVANPDRIWAATQAHVVTGRSSFFAGLAEAQGLERSDQAGVAYLLSQQAQVVAVTHGPRPLQLVTREASFYVTPPRVEAVDTTGCGDVFHAVLAGLLCAETDPVEAAQYAARVSARHSTQLGNGALR